MKKPREFWIWDSVDGTRQVSDYDPGIECFHVIEKSAYDELDLAYSNLELDNEMLKVKADKMAEVKNE